MFKLFVDISDTVEVTYLNIVKKTNIIKNTSNVKNENANRVQIIIIKIYFII